MPFSPRSIALAGLALTLGAAGSVAPASAQDAASIDSRVDAIFADVSADTLPGCAASVMQDGSPVLQRGWGMANLEYDVPITEHSVFHVASVSKHFTAMAIELLVNDGLVSWDDDVRDHVPEVPDFGTPITLRQLVHHTSGIRDQWRLLLMAGWRWEADVVTQHDVLDITSRQMALNFDPGDRWLYSNTGFTLLAVVVERVSGKTLREFTTERIFEPLGMDDTHFHDDHNMLVRNRAWGYAPDPSGTFGLKNSIPDFDVVGATSLFTTAADMAKWDANFLTGEVGGLEAIERMRQPYTLNDGNDFPYGHGLSLGSHRGLRIEGHGGADAGYRSEFLRYPDEGVSVAVLCNFPTANPGGRARRVAEVYLEDRMEPAEDEDVAAVDLPTVPLEEAEVERIVGAWRGSDPGRILRVRMRRDTLFFGGPAFRPLGEGRFEVVGEGEIVTLGEEADGTLYMDAPQQRFTRLSDFWSPMGEALREFEGIYYSSELDTEYHLVLDGRYLQREHRKMNGIRLIPTFTDGFRSNDGITEFTRNASGRIDGFTLSSGRVWGVRFERVQEGG